MLLTYATDINIVKEIKGDVKNQPLEDTEKIWAPDGIRTHDPLCSRSDAPWSNLWATEDSLASKGHFCRLGLRTASRSDGLCDCEMQFASPTHKNDPCSPTSPQ